MAKYSRVANAHKKQRLGSFEIHGVSNTFGGQSNLGILPLIGGAGLVASSSLSTMITTCQQKAASQQTDDELIQCHALTSGGQQNQIASELGLRNYKLVNGQWQKVQASSGTSASEVLTGIAAILSPLATAGVGIFAAQQQADLAKLQLKSGGGYQQPYILPAQNNNSGVIIAVVAVVILLVGMIFVLGKK